MSANSRRKAEKNHGNTIVKCFGKWFLGEGPFAARADRNTSQKSQESLSSIWLR
jgi:hypothetical protein